MTFGRVILGDNQFLGVNHASPVKAAAMSDRFARPDAILEVIGWAYAGGIRDFMFTTHGRLEPVLQEIVRSRLFPGMGYIPCLPYAHKYANTMTEGGMKAVFTRHLGEAPKARLLGCLGRVAVGDFAALMQMLLEIELMMMRGLPVRGVFLQNVIFDLLTGLRAYRMLARFDRHVSERFGATPGYITMNHPLAQRVLCDELQLPRPWVCANFNHAGFRTNPSPDEVQASFGNGRTRNIAMSVLASGILDADASMGFVRDFSGVDCILFGSSSKVNIERNIALLGATAAAQSA